MIHEIKHMGGDTLSNKPWCIQHFFQCYGGWAHFINRWYKKRKDAEKALWDLHQKYPKAQFRIFKNDFQTFPDAYRYKNELDKQYPISKPEVKKSFLQNPMSMLIQLCE